MSSRDFKVSIPIIKWIAESQGSSIEELANVIAPKKPEKFIEGVLNKTQASELVKLGKIPFGFLFLPNPPDIVKPTLPDFRNTTESIPLSDNFYDAFADVQEKLDWYNEYLTRNNMRKKLPFVGKYHVSDSVQEIAIDITKSLKIDQMQLEKFKKEDYFKKIVCEVEFIGILVFRNGIVKVNTRRSLDVDEFRGFAIADKYTPAIFINGNDAPSAQLFTLLHEIAHIWIGEGGVSNLAYPFENRIESHCNKIAAEVLMPTRSFEELWDNELTKDSNISSLSNFFKTSEISVVIKAHQLNLVSNKDVCKVREELEQHLRREKIAKKGKGGGNFYNTLPWRNSQFLTNTIVKDALNQNTLLQEAGRLLHAKPNAIVNRLSERV